MTDKQLALLLRQVAGRLRALAVEIEPLIESGETETRQHFNGELRRILDVDPIDDVRPTAVWRILDLADELADEAELLKREAAE